MQPTLSVIIVTKNEEKNIKDCLESVSFANEIIVLDSLSTDKTVEICKQYTDKIHLQEWLGCGPQKDKALSYATCDWVLTIDADERITPELKTEILNILPNTKVNGFEIPFNSYYCGKKIRFGDWMNESHLRLFRRSKGTIIPRLVHFRVEIEGKAQKLNGKIVHYSFPDLTSVLNKMNAYSTDGAIHKFEQGKSSGLIKALFRGFWAFFRGYIIKLGFLDGREGLLLAISNGEGTYYRYLKLLYLCKNK
jgi:glycosyltransferase involved in cell wall biosynthesis